VRRSRVPAAAALLFALHPLRVGWSRVECDALYARLLFALLATLAFLEARIAADVRAISHAVRESLLATADRDRFACVLFTLDWYAAGTRVGRYGRIRPTLPFVVLAAAAAYVESTARLRAAISDVGVGAPPDPRADGAPPIPLEDRCAVRLDAARFACARAARRYHAHRFRRRSAHHNFMDGVAMRPDERSENVFALAPGPTHGAN